MEIVTIPSQYDSQGILSTAFNLMNSGNDTMALKYFASYIEKTSNEVQQMLAQNMTIDDLELKLRIQNIGTANCNAAVISRRLGDENLVERYNLNALSLFNEVQNVVGELMVYNNLGLYYLSQCHPELALWYFSQAWDLAVNHEQMLYICTTAFNASVLYASYQAYSMAQDAISRALVVIGDTISTKQGSRTEKKALAILNMQYATCFYSFILTQPEAPTNEQLAQSLFIVAERAIDLYRSAGSVIEEFEACGSYVNWMMQNEVKHLRWKARWMAERRLEIINEMASSRMWDVVMLTRMYANCYHLLGKLSMAQQHVLDAIPQFKAQYKTILQDVVQYGGDKEQIFDVLVEIGKAQQAGHKFDDAIQTFQQIESTPELLLSPNRPLFLAFTKHAISECQMMKKIKYPERSKRAKAQSPLEQSAQGNEGQKENETDNRALEHETNWNFLLQVSEKLLKQSEQSAFANSRAENSVVETSGDKTID